jgi:hypothetical protein
MLAITLRPKCHLLPCVSVPCLLSDVWAVIEIIVLFLAWFVYMQLLCYSTTNSFSERLPSVLRSKSWWWDAPNWEVCLLKKVLMTIKTKQVAYTKECCRKKCINSSTVFNPYCKPLTCLALYFKCHFLHIQKHNRERFLRKKLSFRKRHLLRHGLQVLWLIVLHSSFLSHPLYSI